MKSSDESSHDFIIEVKDREKPVDKKPLDEEQLNMLKANNIMIMYS